MPRVRESWQPAGGTEISPMPRKTWLSVVMPVFNGGRHLASALDSILSQTADDVEIVVSDDGSTDGSRSIIESFAGRGHIVAIDGPRQGNWVVNSNVAVGISGGQLVTFLHQDDVWLPGRLAALRASVHSHPARSLWVSPTRFIDDNGKLVGTWRLPFPSSVTSVDPSHFIEQLLVQNFLAMPAPVFTRAAFEKVGGLDNDLWFTADWDLWLKLSAEAGVGLSVSSTTAFRLHQQSQTVRRAGAHDTMRHQITHVLERHLPRLAERATRDEVERAARFSCELNGCLAGAIAGEPVRWGELLARLGALGLRGGMRFSRNARLLERSLSRLRVGLARTGLR